VSQRSTRKIIAGLLEDDFEDEDDFKEVYGDPPPLYWVKPGVRVLTYHPLGHEAPGTVKEVFRSRKDPMLGTARIEFDSDPDFLSTLQIKYLKPLVTEDFEDEDDYKDVWGDPPALIKGMRHGYFVVFSQAVPFMTPTGERWFLKIGPYTNTVEATRKARFGLIGQPGVTARIYRAGVNDLRWGVMFDPPYKMEEAVEDEDDAEDLKDVYPPLYYSVYDNFVDRTKPFTSPGTAFAYASQMREGSGVYGVVDDKGDVIVFNE